MDKDKVKENFDFPRETEKKTVDVWLKDKLVCLGTRQFT